MKYPKSLLVSLALAGSVIPAPDSGVFVDIPAMKKASYDRIAAFEKSIVPLESGCAILYHAQPLRGCYRSAGFDSSAARMLRFLALKGTVTARSTGALADCISGGPDSCGGARYGVLPLEVWTKTTEKKTAVQSVFNLDKEGNFIPSDRQRTLSSRAIEMRCRFVVVDLRENTRVFDAWFFARASSDDALKNGASASGNMAGKSVDELSVRCTLYIIDKVKRDLSRKFR
ncbi:MAG: hypothetical protein JXA71_10615 [Chitinispirillaceae bacterium]|nr:hypothetical protein [Chitinispirillaceae bacterium]